MIVVDTANDQGRYPVQYRQTSLAVKPKNLKLFSGTMEFTVNRMNVQGGGVLVPRDDKLGLGYAQLSFEWQEPVPENWYFVPDSESAEWRQPLDVQELKCLRDEAYQELEAQNGEDYKALLTRDISKVISAAQALINSDGPNARLELRTLLAAQNFYVAMNAMTELIPAMENKNLVQVFPVASQELFDDKEWFLRCYFQLCGTGIVDLLTEAQGLTPAQAAQVIPPDFEFYVNARDPLIRLKNTTGEWYEDRKEFRAAVHYYKECSNLVEQIEVPDKLKNQAYCFSNIGLAYKRLGALDKAAEFYGHSLATIPMEDAKKNKRMLFSEIDEWVGTTGRVPPWKCKVSGTGNEPEESDSKDNPKHCASCGKVAANRCSGCRLVCYCDNTCQKKHWKEHMRLCRAG